MYDVRTEGGSGGQKMSPFHEQTLVHKIRTKRGKGVKQSQKISDVIYGSPLSRPTSFDHACARISRLSAHKKRQTACNGPS